MSLSAVRLISDIHNEPQVYYLGFNAPTDVITLCFLQSAKHYYATRELPPTITEKPAALFAQDTATSVQPAGSDKENTSPIPTKTPAYSVNTDIWSPIFTLAKSNS